MVAPATHNDNGDSRPVTPVTQSPLTPQQKDELFVYVLRSARAFRYARDRLRIDCFNGVGDTHYDILWRTVVRLADAHGNGNLPSNLRGMLEAEVRAAATPEAPEPILNPLLGPPTQMGREDQREGGLLHRIFSASQEESDGSESRARELIDRVDLEYGAVRDLRDFVSHCGEGVPTRDSVDVIVQHVQRRLEVHAANDNRLQLITSTDFNGRDFHNEWLVENALIAGQPALVGGMKKTLKTSVIVDLAASLGFGAPVRFLNHFPVAKQVNVGVFSGESGAATLQETLRRVCHAKSRRPNDCAVHWCFQLPQLNQANDLRLIGRHIQNLGLGVVIFDPIYLSLLGGKSTASPANLFDVGPLLKAISDTCLEAGATPILVHHNTKPRGNSRPGDVPQLEDLAFAGFQEFARQWLLIGRRAPYEPGSGTHRLWLNVGGSAGFSGCYGVDINEGVVSGDFSGRQWQVVVRHETRQRELDGQQRLSQQDERTLARQRRDEEALMRALERVGDNGATLTVLKASSGVGGRTQRILNTWLDSATVVECQVQQACGRGQRGYLGYRLNPDRCVPYPQATEAAAESREDNVAGDEELSHQDCDSNEEDEGGDADMIAAGAAMQAQS